MANILIVGFEKLEAKQLQDRIDAVMKQLGKDKEGESATVILDVQTKWCGGTGRAPYLVVRHSKIAEAEAIARALHSALNLDIEFETISGYLASVTPLPSEGVSEDDIIQQGWRVILSLDCSDIYKTMFRKLKDKGNKPIGSWELTNGFLMRIQGANQVLKKAGLRFAIRATGPGKRLNDKSFCLVQRTK